MTTVSQLDSERSAIRERTAPPVDSALLRRRRFAAILAFAGYEISNVIEAQDDVARELCEYMTADRVLIWMIAESRLPEGGITPVAEAIKADFSHKQLSTNPLTPSQCHPVLTTPLASLIAVTLKCPAPLCQADEPPSSFLTIALGSPTGRSWILALERGPDSNPWSEEDRIFLDDVSDVLLLLLERNQTAANLAERSNYLQNILRFADVGILLVEKRSVAPIVTIANHRFCEFFGIKQESVVGKPYSDLADLFGKVLIDWDNQRARLEQILEDTQAELVDEVHIENPTHRVFNRYTTPARDAKDRVFGRIFFFRDITYDKELEKQLLHSQKMESIGTLAGGVAHDFNNLLTSMLGNTELLKRGLTERPDLMAKLDNIERGAKRAAELTGNLLAFSRRKPTLLKVFDLNRLAEETLSMIRTSIPLDINVRLKLSEHPQTVEADETQIQQVIMNLTLNARDAVKPGGRIVVSTRSGVDAQLGDDSQKYVVLEVDDDGSGIPTDALHRVFEPFYTTKEVGKGTGLGLSMVYGIIKKHQGFIEVHSAPGLGSRFSVYLPPSNKQIDANAVEDSTKVTGAEGRELTILVVDDEKDLCDFCELALADQFKHVLIAHDGKQALEIYNERLGRIDIVLLDLTMPRMAGGECFRHLRKINPDCKIIITSGYSLDTDGQSLLNDGAVGFLSKPYNLEQLTTAVTQAILRL